MKKILLSTFLLSTFLFAGNIFMLESGSTTTTGYKFYFKQDHVLFIKEPNNKGKSFTTRVKELANGTTEKNTKRIEMSYEEFFKKNCIYRKKEKFKVLGISKQVGSMGRYTIMLECY